MDVVDTSESVTRLTIAELAQIAFVNVQDGQTFQLVLDSRALRLVAVQWDSSARGANGGPPPQPLNGELTRYACTVVGSEIWIRETPAPIIEPANDGQRIKFVSGAAIIDATEERVFWGLLSEDSTLTVENLEQVRGIEIWVGTNGHVLTIVATGHVSKSGGTNSGQIDRYRLESKAFPGGPYCAIERLKFS